MNNENELMNVTEHLNTLEKSGIYYTQTADLEDVMIYHFKDSGTRVVFFRKDHTVLEVLYDLKNEPIAIKEGGAWAIGPIVPESEESDEKKSD